MDKLHNFSDKIAIFAATFFYIGYFPFAPGTAGSVAAFILYIFLIHFLSPLFYIITCIAVFFAGIYFSSEAEKIFGLQDPSSVVIDEVLGYLLTMVGAFFTSYGIVNALIGLVLFRFFDILKPFPIKYIDKHVKGGFGIMLDDVVAGLFSMIILRFIIIIIMK